MGIQEVRPIIFLDIDGVMNFGAPGRMDHTSFLPEKVAVLNYLIRESGAMVVVHSTWTYGATREWMSEILVRTGVCAPAIEITSFPKGQARRDGYYLDPGGWSEWKGDIQTDDRRAIAIQKWLDDHPGHDNYVILDDSSRLGHFKGSRRFIRTETRVGLTYDHAREALRILGRR